MKPIEGCCLGYPEFALCLKLFKFFLVKTDYCLLVFIQTFKQQLVQKILSQLGGKNFDLCFWKNRLTAGLLN